MDNVKKKIVTLIILSLIAIIMILCVSDKYWAEIETIANTEDNTGSERINSWLSAWDMFIDNPLGVGGNNFQIRFHEYQGDRFTRGMYGRVAHSLWFTLIPELGILGIFIYFRLLQLNLKDIIWLKNLRDDGIGDICNNGYFSALGLSFMVSLFAFFVTGTFISVLYYAHYWYLTGLIAATVKVAKQIEANRS
nr:O-antigen ligase family protein [Desulfatitalea tepidiphila]